MDQRLNIFIIILIITQLKPFVYNSPIDVYPIKEEDNEDRGLDQNILDLSYQKTYSESDIRKRSELWQNVLRRSQDYGKDFERMSKNDLKSLMKLKGKLSRVGDGIRFLTRLS